MGHVQFQIGCCTVDCSSALLREEQKREEGGKREREREREQESGREIALKSKHPHHLASLVLTGGQATKSS